MSAKTDVMLNNYLVDIRKVKATGSGALSLTVTAPTAGQNWALYAVFIHLDAASGTSEDFKVQIDSADGVAYDTVLSAVDSDTETDFVYLPEKDIPLASGDKILVTFTNTDTNTYGCTVLVRPRY